MRIMLRGLVLPFPSPQRLTADDYESLQRFAAACPGAQIDVVVGRDRQEIAILALDGRQLWMRRNGSRVHIRNAAGGQHRTDDIAMDDILAAFRAGLLDGEASSWSLASKVAVVQPSFALAGE